MQDTQKCIERDFQSPVLAMAWVYSVMWHTGQRSGYVSTDYNLQRFQIMKDEQLLTDY